MQYLETVWQRYRESFIFHFLGVLSRQGSKEYQYNSVFQSWFPYSEIFYSFTIPLFPWRNSRNFKTKQQFIQLFTYQSIIRPWGHVTTQFKKFPNFSHEDILWGTSLEVMSAVGRATLEEMTKWGNYNWSGNAFHLLSPVFITTNYSYRVEMKTFLGRKKFLEDQQYVQNTILYFSRPSYLLRSVAVFAVLDD